MIVTAGSVSPDPLTPARCNLTDFPRLMVDIPRLFASGFNAAASRSPIAWMIGHKLWYRSWHQVPAASLPDDDDELCHLVELGFDVKTFRKAKPLAMRGWVKCADGRLYHPVVAEAALEAWLEKLNQRLSSGAGNAKRWKTSFDPAPIEADIRDAASMLARLNAQSKAIAKAMRRTSQSHPDAIPPGSSDDPGGTPDIISMGSLETGTGTGTGTGTIIDDDERERAIDPQVKDPAVETLIRICSAAGIVCEPGDRRWPSELKRVRQWTEDKRFDMDRDIIPAVQRTLATLGDGETITSLRLIERQLAGHRAKAAAGAPAAAVQPLAFVKPGEVDGLARWREVAAATIGAAAYRNLLDTAQLVLDDEQLVVRLANPVLEAQFVSNHEYRLLPVTQRILGRRLMRVEVIRAAACY